MSRLQEQEKRVQTCQGHKPVGQELGLERGQNWGPPPVCRPFTRSLSFSVTIFHLAEQAWAQKVALVSFCQGLTLRGASEGHVESLRVCGPLPPPSCTFRGARAVAAGMCVEGY